MNAHLIDPLHDPRWSEFLERHPHSSIFHTSSWLEALRRTYGYQPFALTTAAQDEKLTNGLVLCRVNSWITGCRTISLPFSDHCEVLADGGEELQCLLASLQDDVTVGKYNYAEIRPLARPVGNTVGFLEAESFCLHELDLSIGLDSLFARLHKSCAQRKLRRAAQESLTYDEGTSEPLLEQFYRLLVLTRRRHGLPPQPLAWFRNLISCVGKNLKIRLVSKDGVAVASMLTLRHKRTLVYKYGCMDSQYSKFGGMHLLFWESIKDAQTLGLLKFDLGRSEWNNDSLILFKDRLGAIRRTLTYWRYPASSSRRASSVWKRHVANRIVSWMPNAGLVAAGKLLYRHLG